ncbi:MAG TPA: hypothetical protein VFF53_04315 [Geobacteraceae bacterium]|nr:hypothetical protein [Geobacteraceae bacterium]
MGLRFLCLIAFMPLLLPVMASATASPEPLPEHQVTLPVEISQPAVPAKQPTESAQTMPAAGMLTLEELNGKRLQRLQDVAKGLKAEKASMADFDSYLSWMGGALAGYSKYVEAGSFAAGFARYLPVPYAGQAGQLTKFISHFALSLSTTSAAVKSYMNSSQFFINGVEAIGSRPDGKEHELAMLTFYADQQLSRDMVELQGRLASISDLSSSALSFLLGLQQYLGNTDDYWQKTKSLIGRKEADKAEKGALAGSIEGLRTRAAAFNGKLKKYEATVSSAMPRIASLVAYEELRQDMEAKTAAAVTSKQIQSN